MNSTSAGVEMLAVDAARLVGGLYGDSERQVRTGPHVLAYIPS